MPLRTCNLERNPQLSGAREFAKGHIRGGRQLSYGEQTEKCPISSRGEAVECLNSQNILPNGSAFVPHPNWQPESCNERRAHIDDQISVQTTTKKNHQDGGQQTVSDFLHRLTALFLTTKICMRWCSDILVFWPSSNRQGGIYHARILVFWPLRTSDVKVPQAEGSRPITTT